MQAQAPTRPPLRTRRPEPPAPAPRPTIPPRTLADVELRPSERGLVLGRTGEGKSVLIDALVSHARARWAGQDIIIFDTKPRWRASHELNGLPTLARYRRWDTGKGVELARSAVLSPPGDPWTQLDWAWRQRYQVVLAQITRHGDIPWLGQLMRAAYEHKRKDRRLLMVVDESNHWFRERRSWGGIIVEILTSGRENNVGMLMGGQRPRNISVEALESCTNLYWFFTPYREDVKQLRAMGVPETARPGEPKSFAFYAYSHDKDVAGMCRLPAPSAATHRPAPTKG